MADIQIVKRDGRRQSYDNKKVAAVVARAAAGFELDVSPLLDAVNNYVKEGIGSQEVMNFSDFDGVEFDQCGKSGLEKRCGAIETV